MPMREKETYMLIRMDGYLCQDEMAWKIHTGNKYFLKNIQQGIYAIKAASTTEIVLIFLLQNSLQVAFLHVDANIGKSY